MDYISAKEAAEKWGIFKRRVQTLCSEGRIKGAMKVGMVWVIPSMAVKPADNRKKTKLNLFYELLEVEIVEVFR